MGCQPDCDVGAENCAKCSQKVFRSRPCLPSVFSTPSANRGQSGVGCCSPRDQGPPQVSSKEKLPARPLRSPVALHLHLLHLCSCFSGAPGFDMKKLHAAKPPAKVVPDPWTLCHVRSHLSCQPGRRLLLGFRALLAGSAARHGDSRATESSQRVPGHWAPDTCPLARGCLAKIGPTSNASAS